MRFKSCIAVCNNRSGDLVERRTGYRAITNGNSVMNIERIEKPEVEYVMSTEKMVDKIKGP